MYGCNTKQPDYKGIQDTFLVQDGYKEVERTVFEQDGFTIESSVPMVVEKRPRYVYMRNRMSRDCKYDRVNVDPKCVGCTRENHLRDVAKKV